MTLGNSTGLAAACGRVFGFTLLLLVDFCFFDFREGLLIASSSSSRYSTLTGADAIRADDLEGRGGAMSSFRFLIGRLATAFGVSLVCFLWMPSSFRRAWLRLMFSSLCSSIGDVFVLVADV